MGVAFGLAFSAMSALVVAAVPASQTGVASGMNANIRTIGGSIGSAAMASIVTSYLAPTGQGPVALPDEVGYTAGFAALAGGLVLAALAGLLIPSARRPVPPPGEPGLAVDAVAAEQSPVTRWPATRACDGAAGTPWHRIRIKIHS
jgi:hypothetical protein